MSAPFTDNLYAKPRWRRVRKAYMTSQHWTCEVCNQPAEICHHIVWLTPHNIHDLELVYGWDNLQAVCRECHENIHEVFRGQNNNELESTSKIVDGKVVANEVDVLDSLII